MPPVIVFVRCDNCKYSLKTYMLRGMNLGTKHADSRHHTVRIQNKKQGIHRVIEWVPASEQAI